MIARIAKILLAVAMLAATVLAGACEATRARQPFTPATSSAPKVAVPVVRVQGTATEVERVRPPENHPLATIDRDAGISVELRDGSMLWLFGDTAARDDAGQISYFVIGSASWAPADHPSQTQDYADPSTGAPVALAVPTSDFPACPQPSQKQGMWPASAVVTPDGNRDRVVIWFDNICLGHGDGSLVDLGTAVGEWWYDPGAPPIDSPIQATILNQVLFPQRSFGSASVLNRDGSVSVYACDTPNNPLDRDDYGPCRTATTTLDGAADASTYVDQHNMVMEQPDNGQRSFPPGGFSVSIEPSTNLYTMIYSPWPGPTQAAVVRVAESFDGPWSLPTTIGLPGCADSIGERQLNCYASNTQPAFSRPGTLAIGYYDTSVQTLPTRGAFSITTIDIDVAPARPGGHSRR